MIKRSSGLYLITIVAMFFAVLPVNSQTLVESVVAIVGNEVIYLSDIENTVIEYKRSGSKSSVEELRCAVLEEQLISKLFLDQSRIDSIIITDDMVEGELNMRLNDAIRRAGSETALEGYFKKSMIEIRQDIRKALIEQETMREVQAGIAENISVTPAALKRYFSTIPKDSLPVVPAKVQISIIQLDPPENEENKAEARQKLLDIRSEILAGKSFNVEAIMYSEDKETASNGGEKGYLTRGELEKEYADEAFSLTKNIVSKIVETKLGFHIIQLIDRKGDLVNTRHILIKPKVKPDEAVKALTKLDSIANLIRKDSMDFEYAAKRYSSHKDSRINGG
jgi:peptidyl-prolyl cis-trans isomerase SurA